jgi:hypothetical protein
MLPLEFGASVIILESFPSGFSAPELGARYSRIPAWRPWLHTHDFRLEPENLSRPEARTSLLETLPYVSGPAFRARVHKRSPFMSYEPVHRTAGTFKAARLPHATSMVAPFALFWVSQPKPRPAALRFSCAPQRCGFSFEQARPCWRFRCTLRGLISWSWLHHRVCRVPKHVDLGVMASERIYGDKQVGESVRFFRDAFDRVRQDGLVMLICDHRRQLR